jgi:large subunit ribosomal protein L7e
VPENVVKKTARDSKLREAVAKRRTDRLAANKTRRALWAKNA